MTNMLAFCVQLALVIGAGAAVAAVFRLREPRVTLIYWQALLAVCLLLPVAQPWQETAVRTTARKVDTTTTSQTETTDLLTSPVERSATAPASEPTGAGFLILLALGTGVALRALWLTIGAFRLSHLRRTARPLAPPLDCFLTAQERIGVRADVYVSTRIAGPVTFGLIRPAIVVPPAIVDMPAHVQDAIAYHELLHVSRRDWVYEVLEEVVRTVFWFHPAIWWLIGRIQLSREQVVDRATIDMTASRDRYVDALLTVALTKSPLTLVPAPPFLRRSLLKKRVAQILQETTMSTRRLIASLSASAAAVVFATTFAVRAFPLEAEAQPMVDTGAPVQIVKGGEHLLHASMPEYPRRAIEQRVAGDVQLDLVLDDRGEVSDARVLTGPDELRRPALESVLQWHYSPSNLRSTTVQATLRFHLPPDGIKVEEGRAYAFKTRDDKLRVFEMLSNKEQRARAEHVMEELKHAIDDPATTDQQKADFAARLDEQKLLMKLAAEDQEKQLREGSADTMRIVQIRAERVTRETMSEFVQRTGIKVGDTITKVQAKQMQEIASTLDEHLTINFSGDGKGNTILTLLNP